MAARSESTAMRPVVGVSSYTPAMTENGNYSLPRQYLEQLHNAGLETVLLTAGSAQACLARLDGLVLTGGGDIEPAVHGAAEHATTYMIDRGRDDFELSLYDVAVDLGMPVLGICRGAQIVNIHHGGDLVVHLPERFGDGLAHRAPPREPVEHEVQIEPGSALASIVGERPLPVMSWHHQCVDRVGAGLRVVAQAEDGVPEALELADTSGRWMVAVQWHPELDADRRPRQAALFSAFSKAVRSWKGAQS